MQIHAALDCTVKLIPVKIMFIFVVTQLLIWNLSIFSFACKKKKFKLEVVKSLPVFHKLFFFNMLFSLHCYLLMSCCFRIDCISVLFSDRPYMIHSTDSAWSILTCTSHGKLKDLWLDTGKSSLSEASAQSMAVQISSTETWYIRPLKARSPEHSQFWILLQMATLVHSNKWKLCMNVWKYPKFCGLLSLWLSKKNSGLEFQFASLVLANNNICFPVFTGPHPQNVHLDCVMMGHTDCACSVILVSNE